MNPILAAISDKMPSVLALWLHMLIFAAPFAVGFAHRWLAWALFPFAVAFSTWIGYWKYHEAFLQGPFSAAVWEELGLVWVINSLASSILPVIVATAAVCWTGRKKRGGRWA